MTRIGVTGGRDFDDFNLVVHTLCQMPRDAVLVHGVASGADNLCAEWWAEIQEREVDPHPAAWDAPCRPSCKPGHRRPRRGGTYCPAAGNYRNQEMVDSGLDLLIAFPGGSGTADMIRRARTAGVRVLDALHGPVT